MDTSDLKEFISKFDINAEILDIGTETKTARQAADALGVPMYKIVKSIVLTDGTEGLLVILRGIDKIDMKKIRVLTGKSWRMANPEETEKLSGYRVGAVPPISTKIRKAIVDSSVNGVVYCGGGSERHLLKIDSSDVIKYSNAVVADIKKFNPSS